MNHTVKLLTTAIILLIILAALEATILLTAEKEDNQAIPVRVACVGDSITRGTEYTLDLWALLGSNYVIGDFGVGGATVSQKSESAYMYKTAFELSKQFQPNIVIIMLGTNDANQHLNETKIEFVSDYVNLLCIFQSLPSKPKIYIVQPPPIFNNSANLSSELFAQMVMPGIKEATNHTGLPLIDAYTPLVDHPDFFVDGVHPKVEGAQLIANAVYAALDPDDKR